MKQKITLPELFKVAAKNRQLFTGISSELDVEFTKMPDNCPGCYYRKINKHFSKWVSENKDKFEEAASKIFKKQIEIKL